MISRFGLASVVVLTLIAAACGGEDGESGEAEASTSTVVSAAVGSDEPDPGIRLVSTERGASIQAEADEDLIVLDVRTPEEFAAGHLEGAILVDFYDDDFVDQLSELDPNRPYLMYCRSGNRSGQTAEIMKDLGFTDVADVDGGIVAWSDAGLPVVGG